MKLSTAKMLLGKARKNNNNADIEKYQQIISDLTVTETKPVNIKTAISKKMDEITKMDNCEAPVCVYMGKNYYTSNVHELVDVNISDCVFYRSFNGRVYLVK